MAIETDKNGVKRQVDNTTPVPGKDVAKRNSRGLFSFDADIPFEVAVTVGGVKTITASGVSACKPGMKFALDNRVRVTDCANELAESGAGEPK